MDTNLFIKLYKIWNGRAHSKIMKMIADEEGRKAMGLSLGILSVMFEWSVVLFKYFKNSGARVTTQSFLLIVIGMWIFITLEHFFLNKNTHKYLVRNNTHYNLFYSCTD